MLYTLRSYPICSHAFYSPTGPTWHTAIHLTPRYTHSTCLLSTAYQSLTKLVRALCSQTSPGHIFVHECTHIWMRHQLQTQTSGISLRMNGQGTCWCDCYIHSRWLQPVFSKPHPQTEAAKSSPACSKCAGYRWPLMMCVTSNALNHHNQA